MCLLVGLGFDLCVLCGLLDLGCCLIRLIVLLLVMSFSFVVLLDYVCGGVLRHGCWI